MESKSSTACKALRIVLQQWMLPQVGWDIGALQDRQSEIREKLVTSCVELCKRVEPIELSPGETFTDEDASKIMISKREQLVRDVYDFDSQMLQVLQEELTVNIHVIGLLPREKQVSQRLTHIQIALFDVLLLFLFFFSFLLAISRKACVSKKCGH